MQIDLKKYEHRKSQSYTKIITSDLISNFCAAVGTEWPKDSASQIAPTTFMTLFRLGEFELLETMGVKLQNILHGEQLFKYEGDIRVDDVVEYQTEIISVLEKKGGTGKLSFLTFDTQVRANSKKVGSSKSTMIVRDRLPEVNHS